MLRNLNSKVSKISGKTLKLSTLRFTERVMNSRLCTSDPIMLKFPGRIRERSQTTFTRQGRWEVQKCPLLAKVYTIKMSTQGGRWSKRLQS